MIIDLREEDKAIDMALLPALSAVVLVMATTVDPLRKLQVVPNLSEVSHYSTICLN